MVGTVLPHISQMIGLKPGKHWNIAQVDSAGIRYAALLQIGLMNGPP